MVLPIDMPDEKLLQLITHELTHIFEYEILFQGKLGKELTTAPPTWFMEGLASFMAQDEDTTDRMVLRDAVVNDSLPSITRQFGGYFAYRFGHAIFEYIVQKYGWEGLRDFIYEYRNTLGNSVEKPLKRAFDVTPEEFDTRFRTWLRKQYLPALISKGEPTEYGDRFRVTEGRSDSQETSGVLSPSGDLLATLTTYKEDLDVALMNVPERKLIRNLTPGFPDRYEYVIAQFLTTGPVMGRDLAFSPDGDHIALFAKKERGRNLVIFNALSGQLERSIPMKVEQQLNPAYSPDGTQIAFHAFEGNRADIFIFDLASGAVRNLTSDSFFDAAPVFAPDGQSLVYSSIVDGYAKLFRIDLNDPSKRMQLTTGSWNDIDANFSPDGKRIFYASDRQTGRNLPEAARLLEADENAAKRENDTPPANPANFAAYNIYSLDLSSGEIKQFTDVVGGAFTPAAFIGVGNKERMVFSSFYKGQWQVYTTTTDKPIRTAEAAPLTSDPMLGTQRSSFVPPVEVAIDPEKVEGYGGLKLFIDDVDVNAGVNSDQTFVSRSTIFMSDMLGNRRFIASLDSVSTFSNFDFLYLDLRSRMNWGVRLFDDRTYFVTVNQERSQLQRERRLYRQTGIIGLLSYPFDRYHRLDFGGGYMSRDIDYPRVVLDDQGNPQRVFLPRQDNFPMLSSTFTGDSAVFRSFGPISGRRYEVTGSYAYSTNGGGSLTEDVVLDFRQYLQVTSRSLLAARVFAGYSGGSAPNFYYFGGLNTLRGYDFRTFVGDRAFFGNFEYRFPLVDVIATPLFALSQIRGSLFFDIGGAYFKGDPFTFSSGQRLEDARAAVGYGVSMNVFGLELHWDFARRTDLKTFDDRSRTTFWIGDTF
jgi:Tol biopolymer transport system component